MRRFTGCENLDVINISGSVSNINFNSYQDGLGGYYRTFPKNIQITIDEANKTYKMENNIIYSKDGKKLLYCMKNEGSVIIPSGVTEIGSYAFCDIDIQSITIPNTVNIIGERAFYKCGSIRELIFPESVTEFGYKLFGFDNNISKIKIYATSINTRQGTFEGIHARIYVLNDAVKEEVETSYGVSAEVVSSVEEMDAK